jgi:hypothetical protein
MSTGEGEAGQKELFSIVRDVERQLIEERGVSEEHVC